jgi:hypothetical protein
MSLGSPGPHSATNSQPTNWPVMVTKSNHPKEAHPGVRSRLPVASPTTAETAAADASTTE